MQFDQESILHVVEALLRIAKKIVSLDGEALDFGTGELLHPSEAHTIDAIGSGRGETVTALGRNFGVTKGAASQIVGKLHRKGYLIKQRSATDGKEILLSLSAKGKKAFAGHRALHASMDKALVRELSGMSEGRLREFMEDLGIVEAHADRYLGRRRSRA